MKSGKRAVELAEAAARDLRASGMQGKIVLTRDADYDRAREIWNGAVQFRPALFARCETSEQVQQTVRAARKYGLPLSVRCGGHDFAGRALRHDGIVIDLSQMRRVEVEPRAGVAIVAGGATAKDVAAATGRHGLAAVTGNVGAVGMAGLTLGGGYGAFTPKYGLSIDNVLGAEVVLADGEIVTADASRNPDLFWALRGGGGNFGVVTSLRIRLHPVREVLAGLILFPWPQAEAVIQGYAGLSGSAPEELGVDGGVVPAPDGTPTVMLAPAWCGGREQGEQMIDGLRRLGIPLMDQVSWMSPVEMLARFDAALANKQHYSAQTRSVSSLTPEVVATLVTAVENRTSPFSFLIWHHFRGAPTRVSLEDTAFGLRTEHFMTEILSAWEPEEADGEVHRQWARDLSRALAPLALPGGYPNMLDPDARDQIPFAYGSNAERLLALKNRYDPDGVFTSAVPLPSKTELG